MTPHEARFGLTAFALLTAGMVANALLMQGATPVGGSKPRAERASRIMAAQTITTQFLAAERTGLKAADPDSMDTVRAIQRELQIRGYDVGTPDGIAGLTTRAAIMAFEHDHGWRLTAEASEGFLKRLLLGQSVGDAPAQFEQTSSAEAVIKSVQLTLSGLGYNPGKIDGRLADPTARAIREFEVDTKMAESGRISGSLITRLAKAAGNGKQPIK